MPRVLTPHKRHRELRWRALRNEIVAILIVLIFALVLASLLI